MEIPLLINTKLLFNETGDYITGENTATEETEANESEFVLIGGKILNQNQFNMVHLSHQVKQE